MILLDEAQQYNGRGRPAGRLGRAPRRSSTVLDLDWRAVGRGGEEASSGLAASEWIPSFISLRSSFADPDAKYIRTSA